MQLHPIIRSIQLALLRSMSSGEQCLKAVVAKKIEEDRQKIIEIRKKHGTKKVGEVNVNMVYGGMRDLLCLPCETSEVPPTGVKWRGYTLPECVEKLPRVKDGCQPLPEGMFWLLMTGDIPSEDQVKSVSKEWECLRGLPSYVKCLLYEMPTYVHPMTLLSAAVTLMSTESKFFRAYEAKTPKQKLWESAFDDSTYLIANITEIAATIYTRHYGKGKLGPELHCSDWSANFASQMGYSDPLFVELMRMMLVMHCDHETGNVSAHTVQLVGSALSDPFLSFASGLNGLAGPLHGRASQDSINFLRNICKDLGAEPTDEKVNEYIQKMLNNRQTIPGFGHALLRATDPRFLQIQDFCLRYYPDDLLVRLMEQLYRLVPPILKAGGKVQNPFPNVDAYTGVAWQHFGFKESEFNTVIFGVSRALGSLANYIWARAMMLPIERPKSSTMENILKVIGCKADSTSKKSK